ALAELVVRGLQVARRRSGRTAGSRATRGAGLLRLVADVDELPGGDLHLAALRLGGGPRGQRDDGDEGEQRHHEVVHRPRRGQHVRSFGTCSSVTRQVPSWFSRVAPCGSKPRSSSATGSPSTTAPQSSSLMQPATVAVSPSTCTE